MPTLGLIKSIDEGLTWSHLNAFPNYQITKIVINPLNAQSVTITTANGIFKSFDGGINWIGSYTAEVFNDVEYKPGDTTVLYATSRTDFYKSTNGGLSFTASTGTGIDYSSLYQALVAVSASDPNFVSVATITNGNNIVVYTSIDLGTSFTNNGMTPIYESQGWYNFAFDVSPLNKLNMMVAAIYQHYSTDGGATFNFNFGDQLHSDIHEIQYSVDATTIYVCTDGGIYKGTSPALPFNQYNGNMDIAQIYRLGVSKSSAGKVVIGMQDNGSKFVGGPSQIWTGFNGGDGMECFFDPINDNIIYSSFQVGWLQKSTDNGVNNSTMMTGMPLSTSAWTTPWCLDPSNPLVLYCGRAAGEFYKSTDAANTWTLLSTSAGGLFNHIKVATTNPLCIYAQVDNTIVKSSDGGVNWTVLPLSPSGLFQSIAINRLNENDVIVCMTGGGSSNLVYRTLDGGTTWLNISFDLPSVSCNTVIFDVNPADGFYVGTDAGVFYFLQADSRYLPFNQGIPFVPITEMELDLLGNKIYAATYGRGLWKSDLFSAATCPPVADFDLSSPTCGVMVATLTNTSYLNPVSYFWNFPGGVPSTSTATNPIVTYSSGGVYSISLTATNSFGTSTITDSIVVGGLSAFPVFEGFTGSIFPPFLWTSNSSSASAFAWEKSNTTGGFGLSFDCMLFDNYFNSTLGAHHHMVSPEINIAGATSLTLNFDVAHHQFITNSDSLLVWVSTNCGTSWQRVYQKGSDSLETALVDGSSPFYPTASQWRTESLNLNSFVGNTSLMFRFTNVGDYGNFIYVDNINLNAVIPLGLEPLLHSNEFEIYPNPASSIININSSSIMDWIEITNLLGQMVITKKQVNAITSIIDLNELPHGIYFVKIKSDNKVATKKIIKK
jgi:PKD repeat protein/photosystem II stability/assembly factor-like uncharacterized protein